MTGPTRFNRIDVDKDIAADQLYIGPDGPAESFTDIASGGESVVRYSPGIINFATGLSSEEIHRFVCEPGENFRLDRVELRSKGGGSSTSVGLDVYDATAASVIDSVDMGATSTAGGTTADGNTVLVRFSNSSGSAQDVAPTVHGVFE